jgi:hypothetical protein
METVLYTRESLSNMRLPDFMELAEEVLGKGEPDRILDDNLRSRVILENKVWEALPSDRKGNST